MVCFALREVFRDLFHPTWSGSLSDYVGRTLFALFRRSRSFASLAGPLSLVVVISCWASLLAIGFALIFWTAYPGGFRLLNGQHPSVNGFWLMLHMSLGAMTTAGTSDVVPDSDWIRVVAGIEALIGFALVTASISWIVLIYPALARMRTLARRTSILKRASDNTSVAVVSGDVEVLIAQFALDVIRTRVDFVHFPIIYYFHADRRRSSLAAVLPVLVEFAESASLPGVPDRVRLAAATLHAALEDLASLLAERFVTAESNDFRAVFRAYAEHHVIRTGEL
jgi:hypothetical protein